MQDPDPGPGPEAEVQARSPIRPPHITSKAPLPASLFDDSQEEDEEEFLMSACQDEMELIQRHNPTASKEPAKPGSPDENDLGCRSPSPPSPLEQRSESRKRRFPGPAGILPRISTSSLNKIPKIPDPGSESVLPRRPPVKEPSCSQNEIDRATFNSSVWQRMLEDHSIENENDPSAPTQKFNISWVKRKTGLGLSKKTPVLMCAIKSLDLCSVDPSCVLHDRSGDVKATIHR